ALEAMRAQSNLFDPDIFCLFADSMDDILSISTAHPDPMAEALTVAVIARRGLFSDALVNRLSAATPVTTGRAEGVADGLRVVGELRADVVVVVDDLPDQSALD